MYIANKSRMFCFRMTEKDYLTIRRKAEKANLNLTAYITNSALNKQIVVIDGLDKTIYELKAIGKNLNQLTTLCNMGKIRNVDLTETKERFGSIFETISTLIKR